MKLSQLVSSYAKNPRGRARLKEGIHFNRRDGSKAEFKAGTISDLLIDRGDGTFHFEAENEAIIVGKSEIEMI